MRRREGRKDLRNKDKEAGHKKVRMTLGKATKR